MGHKAEGLVRRGQVWHINKQVAGIRLRESTGETELAAAKEYRERRVAEVWRSVRYGERCERTFRQAAEHYVATSEKRSLGRDVQSLNEVLPYIGELPLPQVHMGTLMPFIEARRATGRSAGTVNRTLAVVRRILNLSARLWRDGNGLSWLETAPLIQHVHWGKQREGHPLTLEEQQRLFAPLPESLQLAATFAVHTGCRDQEIRWLRWEWLRTKDGVSYFDLPDEITKNGKRRPVVLNSAALSVIETCKGRHPEYVFVYKHKGRDPAWRPYSQRLLNSSWKRARTKAGLPDVTVHDLRRTCATRLRDAAVDSETRRDVLGHQPERSDMARLYAAPTLRRLHDAVEKLCERSRELSLVMEA